MRDRFESALREAGLDPNRPVSIDRYDDLSRQRGFGFGGFGSGIGGGRDGDRRRDRDDRDRRDEQRRDDQRRDDRSGQAADEALLVPGFGNEFEEAPVATFGDETESADAWKLDYDPNVLNNARDIIRRYDTNRNGILERSEWKPVPWSSDPNASDRNKDGKLSLQEMVERLASQSRDGGRRPGGQSGNATASANSNPSGPRRGMFGGGPEGFYRGLDKNSNGRLDPDELEGNSLVQQQIRDAGLDPTKSVSIQELVEKRSRSGGGERRGFGRFGGGGFGGFGGPGSGFGGFNPPGGNPGASDLTATEEFPADFGEGEGDDPSASGSASTPGAGRGRRGGPGRPGGGIGGAPASKTAPKTESTAKTAAGYRFHTSEELLAKENVPDWFIKKDKNGDGQVAMAEFSGDWTDAEVKRFLGWDANNDGVISPVEAKGSGRAPATTREEPKAVASTPAPTSSPPASAVTEAPKAERTEFTADADAPGPAGEPQPATDAKAATDAKPTPTAETDEQAQRARAHMERYDKDKSGIMERDEWPTSKLMPHADIDANADEKITLEEITSYFRKRFGGN
jgi:hypothetical protein